MFPTILILIRFLSFVVGRKVYRDVVSVGLTSKYTSTLHRSDGDPNMFNVGSGRKDHGTRRG